FLLGVAYAVQLARVPADAGESGPGVSTSNPRALSAFTDNPFRQNASTPMRDFGGWGGVCGAAGREDCLAEAGGFEPPHGGIKIQLFHLNVQCIFLKKKRNSTDSPVSGLALHSEYAGPRAMSDWAL